MDYTVITADNIADLVTAVEALLAEDWVCEGGVSTLLMSGTIYYSQALTLTAA